ncbi:DUF3841 domain-containing protein [Ligilactobacillus equi]|uniref:DUF3841 domain-containing protein n=1 Tax=Ligilactobacillus equi TaxID=137357 RepID=UPI002ED3B9A4
MRLWMLVSEDVYQKIVTAGEFHCEEKFILDRDFIPHYQWMVKQMDRRLINHPKGLDYPLWAWCKQNGKHAKPDFRDPSNYYYDQTVCLELEIPAEEVLLSDYDLWHFVLNNIYLSPIICTPHYEEYYTLQEKCYDLQDNWFEALPREKQVAVKEKTWEYIFETPYSNDSHTYIQACFWSFKTEQIVKAWHYSKKKR